MRAGRLAMMAVALLALAAGIGLAWRDRASLPAASAEAFFTRTYTEVDGATHAMTRWQGQLVVVNFWATWCAPCVEEMPELQRVHQDYADRGVAIVGLGIDSPAAIRRFRAEHRLTLPLYQAGADGSALARELGNPSAALPYTVLIDPKGRIVQARLGQVRETELRAWLDARLSGPTT
jgi:peroxiredoxin